jgi:hypothetical protein
VSDRVTHESVGEETGEPTEDEHALMGGVRLVLWTGTKDARTSDERAEFKKIWPMIGSLKTAASLADLYLTSRLDSELASFQAEVRFFRGDSESA